jgi:hypothetical protein
MSHPLSEKSLSELYLKYDHKCTELYKISSIIAHLYMQSNKSADLNKLRTKSYNIRREVALIQCTIEEHKKTYSNLVHESKFVHTSSTMSFSSDMFENGNDFYHTNKYSHAHISDSMLSPSVQELYANRYASTVPQSIPMRQSDHSVPQSIPMHQYDHSVSPSIPMRQYDHYVPPFIPMRQYDHSAPMSIHMRQYDHSAPMSIHMRQSDYSASGSIHANQIEHSGRFAPASIHANQSSHFGHAANQYGHFGHHSYPSQVNHRSQLSHSASLSFPADQSGHSASILADQSGRSASSSFQADHSDRSASSSFQADHSDRSASSSFQADHSASCQVDHSDRSTSCQVDHSDRSASILADQSGRSASSSCQVDHSDCSASCQVDQFGLPVDQSGCSANHADVLFDDFEHDIQEATDDHTNCKEALQYGIGECGNARQAFEQSSKKYTNARSASRINNELINSLFSQMKLDEVECKQSDLQLERLMKSEVRSARHLDVCIAALAFAKEQLMIPRS